MSGRTRIRYDSTESALVGHQTRTAHRTRRSCAKSSTQSCGAAHPERIILFGSAANGTLNEKSDIDLLVIMETATPRRAAQKLMWATPPQSPPLDILVVRREDVERTRHDSLFVTHDACRHGRVLYDARE